MVLLPNSNNSDFLALWVKARLTVPSYPYFIIGKNSTDSGNELTAIQNNGFYSSHTQLSNQQKKRSQAVCETVENQSLTLFSSIFHNNPEK